MRSLSIGATGMLAQQTNVEVISNNIANLNTTGFKRQRTEFQDLLYQNARRVGSASSDAGTIVPSGIQLGVGVRVASTYRIHSQGTLINTDNKLDVAINGRGYFPILQPSGTIAYTRAGSFSLNADGAIVTMDGFTVQPGITIPPDAVDIMINSSGQVSVKQDGQQTPSIVGQFELITFPNDPGLQAIGNNLYLETAASGSPVSGTPASTGFGSIEQGSIESSNVNIVSEITNMITAQRAYEMNSKVIKTSDDMMGTLTQMR